MTRAIEFFHILIEYAYRFPASVIFNFIPHWYFESTVMAHAIKTPLSTLSLAIDEARQVANSPKDVKLALDRAEAARKKIQSMLFLQSESQSSEFGVSQPLENVSRWFSSLGHEVRLLVKSSQSKPVKLQGNSMLFEQLLEILIHNGLKASVAGSLIVVALSVDQGWMQLVIHDFGEGMSSLEKMACELHGYSNQPNGWGIGMSCARRIVSEFRGHLQINSIQKVGTQIICRLPLGPE